jgi:hypothetical protein
VLEPFPLSSDLSSGQIGISEELAVISRLAIYDCGILYYSDDVDYVFYV